MARLKIALIGAGRRGKAAHLPVITKMSDTYDLVAVCDMDSQNAIDTASQVGANAYTNVRDLVAKEAVDVADVVTPSGSHHAVACFLADHGIHVLCETPLAVTLPLADMMIESARKNNVKLEIAENYYRAPVERLKMQVIQSGAVGDVSRLYRIFYEGGYHGMSLLRTIAGAQPVSVMGISHSSPVAPITDRMKRHHEQERWSQGIIDFDNGVIALMMYSNVIHARALGRGKAGISQIDGTKGTIVGEEVYVVPADELQKGAQAEAYAPQRQTVEVEGARVLKALTVELPEGVVTWTNPFARYGVNEGEVAIADELASIANAVTEDVAPEYGAQAGRLDQEMNIAMAQSGLFDRQTIPLPLKDLTQYEAQQHDTFEQQHGCKPDDIEQVIDVSFERR